MARSRVKRFAYIDALRGIAILMVIAVHTSGCLPNLSGATRALANQGARGVQLFYVVSALTLCFAWYGRGDGVRPFYVRRLFRIAPMYWLGIIGFLMLEGTGPRYWAPSGIDWRDILMNVFFVHEFAPEAITSVVEGGWTIANEMIFYAIFPLLVVALRSWIIALIALIASIFFAQWLYPVAIAVLPRLFSSQSIDLVHNYAFLWLPNQLPAFF